MALSESDNLGESTSAVPACCAPAPPFLTMDAHAVGCLIAGFEQRLGRDGGRLTFDFVFSPVLRENVSVLCPCGHRAPYGMGWVVIGGGGG